MGKPWVEPAAIWMERSLTFKRGSFVIIACGPSTEHIIWNCGSYAVWWMGA